MARMAGWRGWRDWLELQLVAKVLASSSRRCVVASASSVGAFYRISYGTYRGSTVRYVRLWLSLRTYCNTYSYKLRACGVRMTKVAGVASTYIFQKNVWSEEVSDSGSASVVFRKIGLVFAYRVLPHFRKYSVPRRAGIPLRRSRSSQTVR